MRTEGGLRRGRSGLGVLCIGGVLLVGPGSNAAAQNSNAAESQKTDNKVWTSDSYLDPDVARERALQRYNRQNPLFPRRVSGVVRLASGGAPFPPVEIFICGQPVGSTDKKGRFDVPAPPRTSSGFSESCKLSIQYPRTRPISIGVARAQTRRLGILVLQPLPGFEDSITSVTTREAPKAALRAYQKGALEEAKAKANLEKAAERFEEAVALYPFFAEAWTALGRVRLGLGNFEGAALALETSIAADEKFSPPYRTLLLIRMQRGEFARAAVIAAALLRLNPGDDQARYLHALATFGLQRYDEAAASALSLVEKGSGEQFPRTLQILGEIHADRGEIEEAARDFRAYLELAPDAPSAARIRERLRDWETAGAIAPEGERAVGANPLLSRYSGF